jgi:archaemetzincin
MSIYSILDSITYPDKSFILRLADDCLAPVRVMLNGCSIEKGTKEDTVEKKAHAVGMRILAGLALIFTLPAVLMAFAVKWWKKEEWQQVTDPTLEQVETDGEEIEDNVSEGVIPEDQEEFTQLLEQELACVHHLDVKLPDPSPGSWRMYGKSHEYNQTYEWYINGRALSDPRPLNIQLLGTFSATDLKIIGIAADYLRVFHNLEVEICPNILTMDQLLEKHHQAWEDFQQKNKEEDEDVKACRQAMEQRMQKDMEKYFPKANGQYDANIALNLMCSVFPSNIEAQTIAFTSADLFTQEMRGFVFGLAQYYGKGIWSNARFGNPEASPVAFRNCLLRMMKISAHEFGHMRGLPHCTDYECNIGGYMSLKELDERPLLYCLQDTAKVCFLTQTSLLKQHQKILAFFQNFNQTYDLNCDFSKEIKILKDRINVLKINTPSA